MTSTSESRPRKSYRVGGIVVDETDLQPLFERLQQLVVSVMDEQCAKLRRSVESSTPPTPSQTTGVSISGQHKQKAKDLRIELLLGKLPEKSGILIDPKTTAQLLNISPRTLYRLDQEEALPKPVRIGRTLRWRLAELIEWIDSDCPPRRSWCYSGTPTSSKKK